MKGQLLIQIPTSIERAVISEVDSKEIELLSRILDLLDKREAIEESRFLIKFIEEWHFNNKKHPFMHSNGCGCLYCTKTREYANLKLAIHRTRRRLDNYWQLYPSEDLKRYERILAQQEQNLRNLLIERAELRDKLYVTRKGLPL